MKENKKKLLILGATNNEIAIVNKALSLGLYTIVTDNHIDWSQAPAKEYADEAWNISWSDIDTLAQKSRDVGVDGVMAGFSEFRVEKMVKLCEALGLPCYINEEQLEITRNKIQFKNWCAKFGIPVVKEYSVDDKDIRFPVIIKPVDRAGGIGVNVAYSRQEMVDYYNRALELSPTGNVIIEEFIDNGTKFDCYYVINNSQVRLLCTTDTIMYSGFDKGFETIQKAWIYPSKHEKDFIKVYHPRFIRMIESLKMENGYTSISCFYRDNECLVFEAGFRLTGGQSFNYQKAVSGTDYLESMICYSLGLPVKNYDFQSSPEQAVTFHYYGIADKEETINTLPNMREIKNYKDLISVVPHVLIGQRIEPNKLFKMISCTFLYKDLKKAVKLINELKDSIWVVTASGTTICPINGISEEELS